MKFKKKQEKQQLSLGIKREICLFKAKNPKITLEQIKKHFAATSKIEIPISTLSDMLVLLLTLKYTIEAN